MEVRILGTRLELHPLAATIPATIEGPAERRGCARICARRGSRQPEEGMERGCGLQGSVRAAGKGAETKDAPAYIGDSSQVVP